MHVLKGRNTAYYQDKDRQGNIFLLDGTACWIHVKPFTSGGLFISPHPGNKWLSLFAQFQCHHGGWAGLYQGVVT